MKTNNTTETLKENLDTVLNAGAKWFEESSKILTGLYDKQYQFMLDSYTSFMDMAFDSFKKGKMDGTVTETFHKRVDLFLKNIQESSAVMKKMFSGIIDTLTNDSEKGFVKEISDLMQETYSKQTEQLLKFNKNLLEAGNLFSKETLHGISTKEISEKLQKDLEKNLEASKKIIKSISDTYTKESMFSTQSGKKMLDEIFAEIDVVTKNNMKFWNNWFDEVYSENKSTSAKGKTAKNGQQA